MSKIHGLIDDFPNLEQMSSEDLLPNLTQKLDLKLIDNILGNRILYSEVIPETKEDYDFEHALLIQAVKIHSKIYYHPTPRRIYIPERLLFRVPVLMDLVWVFIQALNPTEINTIYLRQTTGEIKILGTYIRPKLTSKRGQVEIMVEGNRHQLPNNGYSVIPSHTHKLDINFDSQEATLLGKNSLSTEVAGGVLGLIVDLR